MWRRGCCHRAEQQISIDGDSATESRLELEFKGDDGEVVR
jgi:hypothetical protein